MKTGYTAEQAASFLLSDTGLSEWQTGFLAVALDEVAEWHERVGNANSIGCHECADELTQMNSQHRGSIEPVVYALTGLSFSVSWRGDYGARTFFVEQRERRDALESDGVSLASLSRVLGMKSTPEGDRRILDALKELKGLVPALSELRYSESDGLVRAGDVLR